MSSKRKKQQGHYCWVCGRHRANERFTGKGHAQHICRDCMRERRQQRTQGGTDLFHDLRFDSQYQHIGIPGHHFCGAGANAAFLGQSAEFGRVNVAGRDMGGCNPFCEQATDQTIGHIARANKGYLAVIQGFSSYSWRICRASPDRPLF